MTEEIVAIEVDHMTYLINRIVSDTDSKRMWDIIKKRPHDSYTFRMAEKDALLRHNERLLGVTYSGRNVRKS